MRLQCDKRALRKRVDLNSLFAFSLINSYRFKLDNNARLIRSFRNIKYAKETIYSVVEFNAYRQNLLIIFFRYSRRSRRRYKRCKRYL